MRKYLYIYKSEVMTNLQYTFNIVVGFIGYFIMLYILFNLWQYLYSDSTEVINGYTINQMTWYVVITEILWSTIGGRKVCNAIINDVKTGNIAYNITKPYNYILYTLFNHLGNCTVKGVMYVILGMFTGFLFLGAFPSLNIFSILAVLLTCILAIVISSLLISIIGLFAFWIEDASPFYWVYSKLILVLGTIFPIEYFPMWLQPFLRFSPVYVVSYGPARLFVNFNCEEFINILIAQIIYIIITYLICSLIYRKGVKRLNVNGG